MSNGDNSIAPTRRIIIPIFIPSNSYVKKIKNIVTDAEWNEIRRNTYREANYRCEICGRTGQDFGYNYPVACSDVWEINDDENRQILTGFEALCPPCTGAKFFIFIEASRRLAIISHMAEVNQIDVIEAERVIRNAHVRYRERSSNPPMNVDIEHLWRQYRIDPFNDHEGELQEINSRTPSELARQAISREGIELSPTMPIAAEEVLPADPPSPRRRTSLMAEDNRDRVDMESSRVAMTQDLLDEYLERHDRVIEEEKRDKKKTKNMKTKNPVKKEPDHITTDHIKRKKRKIWLPKN